MTATLFFHPINRQVVKTGAGTVVAALIKAFGPLPQELDHSAIEKLSGMAATWTGTDAFGDNPYEALANAIAEFGSIQISAEY